MSLGGGFDNPFPGLRPFEAHQAELFFGRDEQVEEVLSRLEKMRFLALVGTSGCGKSSLVRAGLLPALRRGYFGGSSWTVAVLRPGGDPIGKLATELSEAFQVAQSEVLSTLRRSSLGLTDFVRQHCPSGQSLLIVIDQFEELIRYRQEAGRDHREESAAFVKLFLAATGNSELPAPDVDNAPVHVVLTMRSDFLGQCSLFRGLPEALNNSQYLVPRMTREQQREAIEGPVGMAGARITPQLVQRLLNDVGDSPDQLPVLQHALMKTWEQSREAREQGQSVDLPHYESVGRMDRALNLDADRTFGELGGDAEREAIARRMFQSLVGPGSEDDQTRRPRPLSEIVAITGADESRVRQVVDVFRLNGFLTLSADADPIVDITHESLIRLWDRLKGWVKDEDESAKIYVRLAESADRGMALYRGPELTQALRWSVGESPNAAWALRYSAHDLSRAMDFLERSRRARSRDRWIRRGVVVALVAGLAVISVLYFKAEGQRKEALWQNYVANVRAADMALGRGDVKAAKEQLLKCDTSMRAWEWRYLWRRADSSIATLYAHTHIPTPGYEKLATALSSHGNRIYWSTGDTLHVWDASTYQPTASYGGFGKILASNKDGTRILVKQSGVLSVKDAVSGALIATLALPPEDARSVAIAAFDPGGKRIAIGCRILPPASFGGNPTAISKKNGTLAVWDLASGSVVVKLNRESSIGSLAFSPDGRRVVAGLGCSYCTASRASGGDKTLHVWDAASGRHVAAMEVPGSYVNDLAFSPDGSRIAGTVDKDVRIWDVDTGMLFVTLSGHTDSISAVAFSPDGKLVATAADDHTVRIWNQEDSHHFAPLLATLLGHSNNLLNSVAFSSDGAYLLVASQSGEVRIWNATTAGGCLITNHGVNSIAASPDSTRVLSANPSENQIQLWDSASGKKLLTWPQNDLYRSPVQGSPLAFSPDGSQIASGSSKGEVRLWDATSGATPSALQGRHAAEVTALAFAPMGAYLASGSQDKTVRLWELPSGRTVHRTSLPDPVCAIAFDPTGKRILIGLRDLLLNTFNRGGSTAALWSPFRDASPINLSDPPKFLYKGAFSVALSPDGNSATAASRGGVFVWRTSSGKRLHDLGATSTGTFSIAFSPDGARLLFGGNSHLQVWDAQRNEHLLDLVDAPKDELVFGLVFSPDGSRAFSYSPPYSPPRVYPSNGIRIWETNSAYYPRAEQLVDSLREELGFSAEVISRLQTDRNLDPNLRQAALKLAQDAGDNENILDSMAWNVVRVGGNKPEEYRLALQRAEAASRADPWSSRYLRTLGAAQYRTGAFRDALGSLQRSVELSESPRPVNRVLMAMALFHLGEVDKAQAEIKAWRNIEKVPDPERFELEGILREADALISPSGRPAVQR
jgi:WD40 repeat protein